MGIWKPIRSKCPLVAQGLRFEDLDEGWCDHCNERVVNLSELTERQARRLVRRGDVKCIAIEHKAGKPLFRASRLAPLLMLLGLSEAQAADIDVRSGVEDPDEYERTITFGQGPSRGGSLLPVAPCHPHRWPHGPGGWAWISVGRGLHAAWKKVVLECRDGKKLLLRERRDFPQGRERLQFTALPSDTSCEVKLRGGAPKETVAVKTPEKKH